MGTRSSRVGDKKRVLSYRQVRLSQCGRKRACLCALSCLPYCLWQHQHSHWEIRPELSRPSTQTTPAWSMKIGPTKLRKAPEPTLRLLPKPGMVGKQTDSGHVAHTRHQSTGVHPGRYN